jgi:signal transduction histidine kinase
MVERRNELGVSTILSTLVLLGQLPALLLAVVMCWRTANRLPPGDYKRRAWEFLGAGYIVWAAGYTARSYLLLVFGREPALPSLSDLLLLAGYPLVILGLLRLARGPAGRLSQVLPVLDIALTVTAAGVFAWHFVAAGQIRQAGNDLTLLAWTLMKDVAYLALAGGLIALLLRTRPAALRSTAGLAALGIALHTAADWGQAYLRVSGAYVPGHPIEAGWLAGGALIALAARSETLAPAGSAQPANGDADAGRFARALALTQMLVPFMGPLLVAGLIVRDDLLPIGERDPNLAWGLLLAMLVLAVRQAVAGSEARRLYSLVAAREAELDRLVKQLLTAQEDERRRVAFDLHDGLTQMIVSAHLHLEALSGMADPASPQARAALAKGLARTKSAIDEARRVTLALRPSTLDDLGLVATLRRTAQELDADGQWELEFEDGLQGARLDPVVESTVFRIAQEALTNVKKYAQAQRVRIALTRDASTLYLEVRDWGQGFAPGSVSAGSERERLGLISMQERSRLLGGTCTIDTGPGRGTLVRAQIPLANKETVT